ncbi:MAG: hemerythrin domain-containing protein [Kofleriaceae bacterium]
MTTTRRNFLVGSGAALVACAHGVDRPAHGGGGGDDDVTPAEDLMREHGVLRRVMYLYDEAATRFDANQEVPLDALGDAAGIVRHVIEDYHEHLEEDFLFPRFERANKLADLTAVLRKQHVAGRAITDQIIKLSSAPLDRSRLTQLVRQFNHMYRPHAAREDTVLFPELRRLVGKHAYGELGEQFEAKETQMLGPQGFEHAVAHVAKLEQIFGVDDLAKLTPV